MFCFRSDSTHRIAGETLDSTSTVGLCSRLFETSSCLPSSTSLACAHTHELLVYVAPANDSTNLSWSASKRPLRAKLSEQSVGISEFCSHVSISQDFSVNITMDLLCLSLCALSFSRSVFTRLCSPGKRFDKSLVERLQKAIEGETFDFATEQSVGISEFCNKENEGFSCIVKQRLVHLVCYFVFLSHNMQSIRCCFDGECLRYEWMIPPITNVAYAFSWEC